MIRRAMILSVFALIGFGGWLAWNNLTQVRDVIGKYVENGELLTLEARYSPQQIMEKNRKELLGSGAGQRSFQEPSIKYHPYLLIEAKYTQSDRKTREGIVLWGLLDGEIVLDTDTWEKTHGFADAINANANASDFKIIAALEKNRGPLTKEQLEKELHVELDILDPWIDKATKKHLIVQRGNEISLHFQNPKILVEPTTKMKQWVVSKPYSHAQCIAKKYSQSQIERIAKAAFGNDFTIRTVEEVYLPVHSIEVSNPDGSILTTYWNALTGQRITTKQIASHSDQSFADKLSDLKPW